MARGAVKHSRVEPDVGVRPSVVARHRHERRQAGVHGGEKTHRRQGETTRVSGCRAPPRVRVESKRSRSPTQTATTPRVHTIILLGVSFVRSRRRRGLEVLLERAKHLRVLRGQPQVAVDRGAAAARALGAPRRSLGGGGFVRVARRRGGVDVGGDASGFHRVGGDPRVLPRARGDRRADPPASRPEGCDAGRDARGD